VGEQPLPNTSAVFNEVADRTDGVTGNWLAQRDNRESRASMDPN
jgi:hypothetical protein